MKIRAAIAAAALFLAFTASAARAADEVYDPHVADRWNAATLDLFSKIPVQDQGRIKPLATLAIFDLVKVNGRMDYYSGDILPVPAIAWLLDSLFYPEIAAGYKNILVENPEVMQALGLDDTAKRARFSPADVSPHAEQLFKLAQEFSQIDEKQRTLYQNQILNLYDSYDTCLTLMHAMDFARLKETIPAGSQMAGMLNAIGVQPAKPGADYVYRYSELIGLLPKFLAIYQAQIKEQGQEKADKSPVVDLMSRLSQAAQNSTALNLLPPTTDPTEPVWFSPGSLLDRLTKTKVMPGRELETVAAFEQVYDAAGQGDSFTQAATAFAGKVQGAAVERGQYVHIPLEVFFYKARFFYWSLFLFVFSAILVAVNWMAPRSRWLGLAASVSVIVPWALLIIGIALRCVIRGRPPVTSLYETTLFIPAVAITVALCAEWISRKKIALSVASALGCMGMFLAHNYELQGPDTMQSMVAVLNSNFWLSTHVTTVTIGYSAGLLACAIGHVFIFGKAFGLGRGNKDFYRSVTRLTYGVICFGALFSFVGTVLGGIWANNSWGRFWGWDPKENGALLIILWFLFILHARLGGYIRDMGIAVCAVLAGIVVSFSWWGVNLLSIGLHSYGFISGVQKILYAYWGIELGVLALAAFAHFAMREAKEPSKPTRGGSIKKDRSPEKQSRAPKGRNEAQAGALGRVSTEI